jgi:hypothetical protein
MASSDQEDAFEGVHQGTLDWINDFHVVAVRGIQGLPNTEDIVSQADTQRSTPLLDTPYSSSTPPFRFEHQRQPRRTVGAFETGDTRHTFSRPWLDAVASDHELPSTVSPTPEPTDHTSPPHDMFDAEETEAFFEALGPATPAYSARRNRSNRYTDTRPIAASPIPFGAPTTDILNQTPGSDARGLSTQVYSPQHSAIPSTLILPSQPYTSYNTHSGPMRRITEPALYAQHDNPPRR